jgi:RNA polymerase sigma-70 factor (ECF subfamily)
MIDGEEKLIIDAISGEASAFGLLYDKYQPQIYRFIYLKVSHREEAEDLAHQVFFKAWQNIGNYQIKGLPFTSWLYRIARNEVIDHYRTRKPNLNIEIIEEPAGNDPVEQGIDNAIKIEAIRKAILQLNQEQQDVIIMRFVEELSFGEIAKAMDKSHGAVRILQHRAIKNLRKILNIRNG